MSRPVRTLVIDQDQHLQNLRKIIKRDFFGTATLQQESQTLSHSLNSYISNYKSNENQLFSELVHLNNDQWRQKHWWVDKQDKMLMIAQSEKFKALPYHNMLQKNQEVNGIDTTLVKQDAKNSFFFNRESNYGSLHGPQHEEAKKVVYRNCKLDDALSRIRQQLLIKRQQITPLRTENAKNSEKRVQNEESFAQQLGLPMTWGEIESTPVRIAGPQFKIPDTPQRQIILHNLNSKINKEKLQPAKKSEHMMKILGSLTPKGYSSKRMASSVRVVQKKVKPELSKEKNDLAGLLNFLK